MLMLQFSLRALQMSPPKPPARSPTRQSPKPSPNLRAKPSSSPAQPNTPPEIVDPIWLAKALALSVIAALLCAWLTACLLFYQGEWQLILHPGKTIDRTPASANLPFQEVRFDAAETGQPRLTAWWIPAVPGTKYEAYILLYLHDGTGSLSSTVDSLARLHQAGINIFAIDYRGFGQSDGPHPTESRMADDAAAALDYLVNTRHIPETQIIPYGEGLGAVLAANLAASHRELPAVIVDNPDPLAFTRATTGGKFALLPMRSLMQEHFDIATAIRTLKTPKLLLADGPQGFDSARVATNQTLFRSAPDPKMSVTFDDSTPIYPQRVPARDAYVAAVNRFLDEYVH